MPASQMIATQVIQPVQQSQVVSRGQQPRGQQISYLVDDEQQPRTSRQLHFTISPSKSFNTPSVVSVTGGDTSHNIPGLSNLFGNRLFGKTIIQLFKTPIQNITLPHTKDMTLKHNK